MFSANNKHNNNKKNIIKINKVKTKEMEIVQHVIGLSCSLDYVYHFGGSKITRFLILNPRVCSVMKAKVLSPFIPPCMHGSMGLKREFGVELVKSVHENIKSP